MRLWVISHFLKALIQRFLTVVDRELAEASDRVTNLSKTMSKTPGNCTPEENLRGEPRGRSWYKLRKLQEKCVVKPGCQKNINERKLQPLSRKGYGYTTYMGISV